jgi:hypothetical protein
MKMKYILLPGFAPKKICRISSQANTSYISFAKTRVFLSTFFRQFYGLHGRHSMTVNVRGLALTV